MQEAGELIELVQTPVGTLVEEIDGTHLLHADVAVREEILILLHSRHPAHVQVSNLRRSMSNRNAASVNNRLGELKKDRLIHGDAKIGYRLTQAGYASAVDEIRKALAMTG